MSQEKINSEISRREQFHQKIAQHLGPEWTANSNGVTSKTETINDPNRLNTLYGAATRTHDEYIKMVKEENTKIAAKLNELMKEEQIIWHADAFQVSCTHQQEIAEDKYLRSDREESGIYNFKCAIRNYGINVQPFIWQEQTRRREFGGVQGKVNIDAYFMGGKDLEDVSAQIDKALVAKNAQQFNSKTDKVVPQKKGDGTYLDKNCPSTQHKESLNALKQDKIKKDLCENLCNEIARFCNKYPKVDGLQQMNVIITGMAWNSEDANKTLAKLIEVAQWKKSDSEVMKGFHEIRGRDPKVETFYQKLAALDPDDIEQVKKFRIDLDHKINDDIFTKIRAFQKNYPDVDGLQQMVGIITGFESGSVSANETLTNLIELAQSKKSDSGVMKAFHELRGRDSKVEEFYQRLATLDPQNEENVSEFLEFLDEKQSQKLNM
ncbi:hypothetical protein OQJ13_01955 [Legionella sp. PATHC035]|uniref:hypothetical protein n=1 Tax=Legionella sp. PATHC035 TaxID=2992040 RepID=UPI0022439D43|nr:hypothetical protein [Legionella sp. PATHC035]MCW8407739.1 hypothetical protein [Legionella sp. PATHC035]